MGVPHIVFGDERGHVQMQGWIGLFLHHRALQPLDGLLHHLEIQIQADRGDVARLLLAQEVPAPRISRSAAAIRKPDPNSVNSWIATSRFWASPLSAPSSGMKKYA